MQFRGRNIAARQEYFNLGRNIEKKKGKGMTTVLPLIKNKQLPFFDPALAHRYAKHFKLLNCLKPGDIICFYGPGFISWAIRSLTENQSNHVGIMADEENIIHARAGYGVVMQKLNEYMAEDWRIRSWIRRLEYVPDAYKNRDEAIKIVIDYAKKQIGNAYDGLAITHLLFRSIAGKIPIIGGLLKKLPIFQNRIEHFCSELVNEAYMEIGISFQGNHSKESVTPGDLFKAPFLKDIEQF